MNNNFSLNADPMHEGQHNLCQLNPFVPLLKAKPFPPIALPKFSSQPAVNARERINLMLFDSPQSAGAIGIRPRCHVEEGQNT